MFVIVFLEGRDEGREGEEALLARRPATVSDIVRRFDDIFADTYALVFNMLLCVRACLALSVSDSNKSALATPAVMAHLERALHLFLRDGAALKSGGGGKDAESAGVAVEALLQLSYMYPEDRDLQEKEAWRALEGLMEGLGTCERLGREGRRHANALVSRLKAKRGLEEAGGGKEEVSGPEGDSSSSGGGSFIPKHVMASYCWKKEARPDLVKAVCEKLGSYGKDVWRDEVTG